MSTMTDEKATECPDCGVKKGPHRYAWQIDQVPCADPRACIKNLKERIEAVEATLERHNF